MKITGTRLALCLTSALLGAPSGAVAQALRDVRTPETPLVLKAQGSFFVGGEKGATVT